ncbi:TolC family protein [Candidatus Zixiibacteriota bacterium]
MKRSREKGSRMKMIGNTVIAGVLIIMIAGMIPSSASAQQVGDELGPSDEIFTRNNADLVLTLQNAIDLALEQSFSIYALKQQFLQTSYLLENAKRQLRTRVDWNSTLPGINQVITPELLSTGGGGDPELVFLRDSSKWIHGELNVVQPLITNGQIILTGGVIGFDAFRKIPDIPQIDARSVQPSVGVRFNQPLFQYNQVKGTLQNAELSLEGLQLSYTEDELQRINQVSTQFYALFAQQTALGLADTLYQQSERNHSSGERRFNAGLLAETDVMRLDVTRMNDLDALESARNQLEQQQFAFNRMVGLELDLKVWADASIEYRPIEVDLDRALELAFENRSDMRRAEIAQELLQLQLKRQKSIGRPDLQLNVGYDLTGNSSLTALPGDAWSMHFDEALKKDNRSPNTNVTLTLQVPLFDWGRNASLVERLTSQIQVTDRQADEVRQELIRMVTDRVRSVESAMRRFAIQEANVRVAETSYGFTQRRFDRGEITFTELAQAQDQLSRTRTLHLTALIGYEIAKADLKEITLWDWETNQPARQRTQPPEPFEKANRRRR